MKNLTAAELAAEIKSLDPDNRELAVFLIKYMLRGKTGDWFQYRNGNGIVELNKKNGSLITTVLTDDEFDAEFPLNIDVNISNRCMNGCKFCYAGCTPDGVEADLKGFVNSRLFKSLRPGTELALNGNEPFHPDLELLLKACARREIMANLTVRYNTFVRNRDQMLSWQKDGLIHGIGISIDETMDFSLFKDFENIVFHTIRGITSIDMYNKIRENHGKALILGYKTFGFGVKYAADESEKIENNAKELQLNLPTWLAEVRAGKGFSVLSFDNLALEQCEVQKLLTDGEWESFYRGEDGHHTMYMDLATMKYCKNSMTPENERFPIDGTKSIDVLFTHIKKGAK